MFALVQFDDGVYFICRANRITSKSGDTCCVKYTDGGRYPARQLSLNADREYLENLKKRMQACNVSENNPVLTSTTNMTNQNKRKKKINGAEKKDMLNNNRLENDASKQKKPKNRIRKARKILDNDGVLTDTTNQNCYYTINQNEQKNPNNAAEKKDMLNDNGAETDALKQKKPKNQIHIAREILDNNGVLTGTTNQNYYNTTEQNEQKNLNNAAEKKDMLNNNRAKIDALKQKKPKNQIHIAREILDNNGVLADNTTNQKESKNSINAAETKDELNNNRIETDTLQQKKPENKIYKAKEILDNDRVQTDTTNQNEPKNPISAAEKKDMLNSNGVETHSSKQNKQELTVRRKLFANDSNDSNDSGCNKIVLPTYSELNDAPNITAYDKTCDADVNRTFTMFGKQQSAEFLSLDGTSDVCNITSPNAAHLSYSVNFSTSMKADGFSDDIRCGNQSIAEQSNLNGFFIEAPEVNTKNSNVQRTKKLSIISDEIINISTENETTHISGTDTSSDFTKIFYPGINNESLLSYETALPLIDTANIPSTSLASENVVDAPHNSGATSTPLAGNPTFEDTNENGMEEISDSASEYQPSADNDSSNATSGEENNSENDEKQSSRQSKNRSYNERRKTWNSSRNSSTNVSSAFESKLVRDDAHMFVVTSDTNRGQGKRTFCMYCQKMQSKFARHLEFVHKDVTEVKAFSALPKGTAERKKIIDTIRKNCQFFFNTNNSVNDGELIVCRRPRAKLRRSASDFQVCHHCKGFYSKNNIRHHAQTCFGYNGKKSRTLMIMGRRVVAHLHEAASERLINVFAVLREDAIVRLIRYDRLLILYGNKLCRKYKKQHDGDMIRANLRMLGRLLSALKEINKNIIEFATIYDPKYYDDVISAINIVSLFNEKTNTYTHPSTAYSLGSLVKQIGNLLITDCIKRHDAIQKANTEDFLKLALDDIGVSVNKTVVESQSQQKRRKKTELPSVQDIKKLLAYVDKKRKSAYQILETKFTYDAWLDLAQTTLTSVQVFNRRRAGEIERVFIEDFESFEGINEDHLEKLSADSQVLARKYVRFVIRGKLNRTVPVLLSSDLLACIQMMLKYRNKAEVPSENRYVFGIPGFEKNRYKYLRACYLLRKFAQESGADFPAKLTGTKLRKHIATNCINLNLSENEVNDVANFMGHADKIHREHYRQPIVSREILRISKVLELAQGCVEDAEECTDDEEEDSDNNLLDDHRKIQKEINTKQQPIQTYDASCEIDDISNNLDADSLSEVENNLAAKYKRKATSKSKAINQKKKKRSTSPYGAVKSKPRWTQEENEVAHKLFGKHILSATYPSLRTIQNLCTNYPSLAKRSPSVIKTWISNKIKKNKLEQ